MTKRKLVISLNQTIGIKNFMERYLDIEYDDTAKLTHYQMEQYLLEKGHKLPKRVRYNNVNITDINNGTYVAVREETKKTKKGKILLYENPKSTYIKDLYKELHESANSTQLRKIRERILKENFGLALTEQDEIIPSKEKEQREVEDSYEINNSINRQRVYKMSSRRHVLTRRKY